jgi:hypothetical protein
MKEIISDIKNSWKETPNSVKFWNGLVLVGLIVTGVLSLELLGVVLGILSLFAFVLWFDCIGGDEDKLDKHLWVWFTPVVWIMMILGVIIYGCIKLYENSISKFNDWLDKQK